MKEEGSQVVVWITRLCWGFQITSFLGPRSCRVHDPYP